MKFIKSTIQTCCQLDKTLEPSLETEIECDVVAKHGAVFKVVGVFKVGVVPEINSDETSTSCIDENSNHWTTPVDPSSLKSRRVALAVLVGSDTSTAALNESVRLETENALNLDTY